MIDLERRKAQVFSETIQDIKSKKGPFVSLFTVQQHEAVKRGKHNDYRIVVDDKAISFFDPKGSKPGLPKRDGTTKNLIRGPDHKAEYALWEGIIPPGEYGAGSVKVIDKEPAVIQIPDKNNIDLRIYRGPNEGNYKIFNVGTKKNWKVYKRPPMPSYHEERMKFSNNIPESVWTDPRYVAEEKLHGAFYYGVLGPKGISFISRRKGVKGDLIHREENVPHLRDIKVPKKYQGTVIAGEMNHPKGFHFLGSLLNSTPDRAVEVQNRFGKVKFMPFELVKLPDMKTEIIPYKERRLILNEIAKGFGSPYIELPRAQFSNKKKFYEKVIREGGEGVVLKNMDEGYRKGTWLRKKKIEDYDAKIVDFEPGKGKYENKAIGVIWVEDINGNRFRVGTGFTDSLREDMYKHPERYLNKLVKIKKQSITAPVFSFAGFTLDKNTPDSIPLYKGDPFKDKLLGGGIDPKDVNKVKYSILSRMGINKKAYINGFMNELKRINGKII